MIKDIYIAPKTDLTFKLAAKYKYFRGFIDKHKLHKDIVDIQDIKTESFEVIIYSPNHYKDIYLSLLKNINKHKIVFYLPIFNTTTKFLNIASFVYKVWEFLNRVHICKKTKLTRYEEIRVRLNIDEHSYCGRDIVVSNQKTTIGKYTSIANGVYLGTSQHPTNFLTMHPMTYTTSAEYLYGDLTVDASKIIDISDINQPVVVGSDCWIGTRAIVMDGVTIGDGAIIAAGAVVTSDVPPYAIVGGIPAKVIKYRFDKKTIERLLRIKWWNFSKEIVTSLPFDNVDECIKILTSQGPEL